MKFKLFFCFIALSMNCIAEIQPEYRCETLTHEPHTRHVICEFKTHDPIENCHKTKKVDFLYLRGKIEDTAYYHGYYLAEKISKGAIRAVINKKKAFLNQLPATRRKLFSSLSKCILNNFKSSVSREFIELHRKMAQGVHDAGHTELSEEDFIEASLAVELSIYFEGLTKKFADNKLKTTAELTATCGIQAPFLLIEELLSGLAGFAKELKMGCTGIAAPAPYTNTGQMMHARNFDSSLLGTFEKYPVVIFQDPPDGYRYVGVGSAGLHYAGGITGFNEQGISVSLHELQTEEYRSFYWNRKGITGPYLQNHILERASSIDEAFKIVKKHGHFGAWTILISDAKTGEIASFEFTGRRMAVARRVNGSAMAQSNHFLAPAMKNANFEYSYNKTLESRSRLNFITKQLERSRGNINAQWMIEMLAGHIDNYVGLRSFGRTPAKAYSTMSHVMIPGEGTFYMSLGETYPVPNSTFVGFRTNFDFENAGLEPFKIVDFKRARNENYLQLPSWMKSLRLYTLSYLDYTRRHHDRTALGESLNHLSEAITTAGKDGIFELPYYFIRARVTIAMGAKKLKEKDISGANELFLKSINDLKRIIVSVEKYSVRSHPYQTGLCFMWLGRATNLLSKKEYKRLKEYGTIDNARSYYERAHQIHADLASKEKRPYFLLKTIDGYYDKRHSEYRKYTVKQALRDEIDFITIE